MSEIDILLKANAKGCLIVDKSSNVVLEGEELHAAHRDGLYRERDDLLPLNRPLEVSGPYPGCMQLAGFSAENHAYRLIGQTEHFVLFYPTTDEEVPGEE
jgi:hypothetical protein